VSDTADDERHHERFLIAGIVSSSVAGIVLGLLLGLAAPHYAVPRLRRMVRVLLRRQHPRWEMLTQ